MSDHDTEPRPESVVRCVDCRFFTPATKYWQMTEPYCELFEPRGGFYWNKKRFTDESFCSFGERRQPNE